MSRLAVILIAAVLLVLLADRAVEPLLERAASHEELSEPLDQTGRFLDLLSDARLLV